MTEIEELVQARDRIKKQFHKTRWTYGIYVNPDDLWKALEALDYIIKWNDSYSRDCRERKVP